MLEFRKMKIGVPAFAESYSDVEQKEMKERECVLHRTETYPVS